MLPANFVFIAALVGASGTVLYGRAMLRGQVHPNRVSWCLWGAIPLIAFAAELREGVGVRSIMTFAAGIGPLAIVALSFVVRDGYWNVTRLDWACGTVSVLTLGIWALTNNPTLAIALSIAADALAATPTLRKAYRAPHTEHLATYLLGAASGGLTVLTISAWTFANAAFPLYVLAICSLIGMVIAINRRGPALTIPTVDCTDDAMTIDERIPAATRG